MLVPFFFFPHRKGTQEPEKYFSHLGSSGKPDRVMSEPSLSGPRATVGFLSWVKFCFAKRHIEVLTLGLGTEALFQSKMFIDIIQLR